jgi:hypothetical protein
MFRKTHYALAGGMREARSILGGHLADIGT